MRRRLLALGCAALALGVGGILAEGCGADAVGLCDFNECVAPDGAADGAAGADGSEEGSVVSPGDGGVKDGSKGGDAAAADSGGGSEDAADTSPPSCGADASEKYCGADAGCVDTTTSSLNCGGCGNVCPGPTTGNGSGVCTATGCTVSCVTPSVLCEGACVINTGEPSSDPCAVSTAPGIFVAPTGSDSANGAISTPVQTITKGLALATVHGGPSVVYVCDATYAEALTISGANGLAIYGGLVCPGGGAANPWDYDPGGKVTVAPAAPANAVATALTVNQGTTGLTIEDFAFTSPNASGVDGNGNGESSIAVMVNGATGVVFKRVTMTAGNGAVGAAGVTKSAYSGAQAMGGNAPATLTPAIGGAECTFSACPDGNMTIGGKGGNGVLSATPPAGAGETGSPTRGEDAGIGGAGETSSAECTGGGTGASGAPGAGGAGATALGMLSQNGWMAGGTGMSGAPGETAQGGGGGGAGLYASLPTSGGGGGGGCGGCGGAYGAGGAAGGASIALQSANSAVTVNDCVLTSTLAGAGGLGGPGQAGQLGGFKGEATGNGCQGGPGGNGGNGGGGGGGAGGSSFDLAYVGTAPTMTGTTLSTSGSPGMGGGPGTYGLPTGGTGATGVFATMQGF